TPAPLETATGPADSALAAGNSEWPPWFPCRSASGLPGFSFRHIPATALRAAPVAASCKNLLCRQDRIAVDCNRVLYVARIAAGVSNHHRDVARLCHLQHQLIALLQTLDRQRQAAQLVFFIRISTGNVAQ